METKLVIDKKLVPETKLLLNADEAAERLGLCTKTIYQLAHRSDFPTVKIGRRTLFSAAGLAEWVRMQEQNRMEVKA